MDYDLLVIGGGPGGYSAAITAAKEGLSVALFEGEHVGGTCLNVGCIPTKYLLDKAAAMEKERMLVKKKIFKECGMYSFQKIQEGKTEVVRKLVSGVEHLLKANKVEVVRGFASLSEAGKVECDGRAYTGRDIIIATGSLASSVPVPGTENTITSTEALELTRVPRRLAVIGGGVIGMEMASAYCSFGSDVTVIEVLPELFPAEDEKAVSYMTRELKKRGIKIYHKTKVDKIEQTKNAYNIFYSGGENGRMEADVVLMAAGRRPNLRGINAGAAGIVLTEKGEIQVNASTMETSVPHVYAIGDVAGGYQLAHAAYAEGEAAINHILGRKEATGDSTIVMPRCIYTMPAYAATGMTEKAAAREGIEVCTGEFSYGANGMALAEGAEGLVRVVMDKKTKVTLGVQIVGENAPEIIAFATCAVQNGMSLADWENMIVPHPSLSEMVKEAAIDCFGKSVHQTVR